MKLCDPQPVRQTRVRIAHVGYLDAHCDREGWSAVRDWLRRHSSAYYQRLLAAEASSTVREDVFDLNSDPPRDFLADSGVYETVVFYNLWGSDEPCGPAAHGPHAQSPSHARAAWMQRLLDAQSDYYFFLGRNFNVWYFDGAALPGYARGFVGQTWFLSLFASRRLHPDWSAAETTFFA